MELLWQFYILKGNKMKFQFFTREKTNDPARNIVAKLWLGFTFFVFAWSFYNTPDGDFGYGTNMFSEIWRELARIMYNYLGQMVSIIILIILGVFFIISAIVDMWKDDTEKEID